MLFLHIGRILGHALGRAPIQLQGDVAHEVVIQAGAARHNGLLGAGGYCWGVGSRGSERNGLLLAKRARQGEGRGRVRKIFGHAAISKQNTAGWSPRGFVFGVPLSGDCRG